MADKPTKPGDAVTQPRKDLSDVFGSGMNLPLKKRQSTTEAQEETPRPVSAQPTPTAKARKGKPAGRAPQPATEAATPSSATEPTPTPRKPRVSQTVSVGTRPIPMYLTSDLHERLQQYKRQHEVSIPNIVMSAIEATYEKLPALIQNSTTELTPPGATRLFNRPATVTRRLPRGEGVGREVVNIRVSTEHADVIDHIKDEVKAPSRNALLTTALTEYLKD